MTDPLQLEHFLPYRLSVLSNTISSAIAAGYSRQFDLSIPEWRVLAVLAIEPGLSAAEVAARTAMDKVAVSRAVARLLRRGRIERSFARDDRRRSELRLSHAGESVYREVVPLARRYESALLQALEPHERTALDELLTRLRGRAVALLDT
jgi:DNA-binding MarR family transcriptional regulator